MIKRLLLEESLLHQGLLLLLLQPLVLHYFLSKFQGKINRIVWFPRKLPFYFPFPPSLGFEVLGPVESDREKKNQKWKRKRSLWKGKGKIEWLQKSIYSGIIIEGWEKIKLLGFVKKNWRNDTCYDVLRYWYFLLVDMWNLFQVIYCPK